jgi:hypothetical protein
MGFPGDQGVVDDAELRNVDEDRFSGGRPAAEELGGLERLCDIE